MKQKFTFKTNSFRKRKHTCKLLFLLRKNEEKKTLLFIEFAKKKHLSQ